MCWSTVAFIVSNFCLVIAPNYPFFMATRFFCGFFSSPFFGGTFVLGKWFLGNKYMAPFYLVRDDYVSLVFGKYC